MQWYEGMSVETAPQMGFGEKRDKSVLENCLGGRYSPGIDLTFVVRDVNLYKTDWQGETGPFRINEQPLDYKNATADVPFLSVGYTSLQPAAVNQTAGQQQLDFAVNGEQVKTFNADFVVDASGKAGVFTRHLEVFRNTFDDVVYLCAFIDLPVDYSITSHTFVEAVEHGWWYAAQLPGNKMIVTFCTDRQNLKAHDWQQLEKCQQLLRQSLWISKNVPQQLLRRGEPMPAILIQNALSSLLSAVCSKDWLAVGDAACSYDPITSAGITKALMHGELAD